jgi:hypothetical protein
VLAVVILHGQVEIDPVDIRVGGDEVGVDLLLLSVLKDLLNESLEVLRQVFVPLK